MLQRFFGAARNERGGSIPSWQQQPGELNTGSKMDDVVYEEFKGTGNMELVWTEDFRRKRVFPASDDIAKSSARRKDLSA